MMVTVDMVVGFLVGVGASAVMVAVAAVVAWWTDGPDPDVDSPGTERWELRSIPASTGRGDHDGDTLPAQTKLGG